MILFPTSKKLIQSLFEEVQRREWRFNPEEFVPSENLLLESQNHKRKIKFYLILNNLSFSTRQAPQKKVISDKINVFNACFMIFLTHKFRRWTNLWRKSLRL